MPGVHFGIDHSIARNFQFDYVLADGVFLILYVTLLVVRRRFAPLLAGLICGSLIYLIDGVYWSAIGVRQYELVHAWMKHPVDFMMDVSYGIVMFSWTWIAFERRSRADVLFWTCLVFAGWLLVPGLSRAISMNDAPVMTVRHMQAQVPAQLLIVLAGYTCLVLCRYRPATILYVFWIGCMLAFMMESSLMIHGIRKFDVKLLAFETIILLNQGIPYVFLVWDKFLPWMKNRYGKWQSQHERKDA